MLQAYTEHLRLCLGLLSCCNHASAAQCSFPLLFHSLVGKDEREANSPSWFNALEAKQVISYVTQIMTDPEMRRNRVTADQIGIITPYRRQVQKIKKLLVAKGYGAVQVRC